MTVKKQDKHTRRVFLSKDEFAQYIKNNTEFDIKTSIKQVLYSIATVIKKAYFSESDCTRMSVTLTNAENGYNIDICCIQKNTFKLKTLPEYHIIFEHTEQMINFFCGYFYVFKEVPDSTLYFLKKYHVIINCEQRKLDFLSKYGLICVNKLYTAHLKEYGRIVCEQKNIGRLITAFTNSYTDR